MNAKKIDDFSGPECGNCTATKTKADQPLSQKCNRCKLVSYCSRECQVQHWKSGDHQKWCLTPKERSVQQSALARKEDCEANLGLHDNASNCPVCLAPIVVAKIDLNVTLPCLHVFHISCVEDLRSHALQQACPLCRAELPSKPDLSAAKGCANCGNEKRPNGAPIVSCANCKLVFYCGRDCQRAHWKHGGHKAVCAQASAERIVAEINKPLDSLGMTQLLNAVLDNKIDKVRLLLDQGAAVNQGRTHDGMAPLFIAAHEGHTEVASLLINVGAAVNQARMDNGTTPLSIAAQQGYTEVVSLLIGSGAAVNQADTDNDVTALFIAAQHGHDSTVELLIELGADTNHCMLPGGWSPLFVAAWSGHTGVVRILLAASADKAVATTSEHLDIEADCTPQSIAARLGHSEVSGLLSE